MVTTKWVLSLMLAAQPEPVPWRNTYDRSAEVIATASEASPLFDGADGAAKTAALLVSVGRFESGFKPDAEGDCDKTTKQGTCVPGSRPHSFCMMQLSEGNFRGLGTTREEVQTDIARCVALALRMMHQSFSICRGRPMEDRLAWYAAGSATCPTHEDAVKKSRHRVMKGIWLFKNRPPPTAWEAALALGS